LDKKTQLFLFDAGFFDVTRIEQKLLEKNSVGVTEKILPDLASTTDRITDEGKTSPTDDSTQKDSDTYPTLSEKQIRYKKVPELSSIDGYINTDGKPITLESLRGKVVLLDIWTYSCINCQRTIPYLNEWYSKYKDQGLEVIGLHTPEFAFEKVQTNVEKAVKGFNITYPVVLDNDYSTWIALGNQFWPRKYLVDIDGYIIYDHIGEGSYEETERAIQTALKERSVRMGVQDKVPVEISTPTDVVSVNSGKVKSPEIYFGSSRNQYFLNGIAGKSGEQNLAIPSNISFNGLYLGGMWNITPEYAENEGPGSVVFNYEAKNVYMAAGSSQGVEIEIYKDDVFVKKIMVKDEKLYPLIEDADYGKHILRIVVPKAGLKAFTFTFG
jgi:thiol-disulfide isomerase/thioredoxin